MGLRDIRRLSEDEQNKLWVDVQKIKQSGLPLDSAYAYLQARGFDPTMVLPPLGTQDSPPITLDTALGGTGIDNYGMVENFRRHLLNEAGLGIPGVSGMDVPIPEGFGEKVSAGLGAGAGFLVPLALSTLATGGLATVPAIGTRLAAGSLGRRVAVQGLAGLLSSAGALSQGNLGEAVERTGTGAAFGVIPPIGKSIPVRALTGAGVGSGVTAAESMLFRGELPPAEDVIANLISQGIVGGASEKVYGDLLSSRRPSPPTVTPTTTAPKPASIRLSGKFLEMPSGKRIKVLSKSGSGHIVKEVDQYGTFINPKVKGKVMTIKDLQAMSEFTLTPKPTPPRQPAFIITNAEESLVFPKGYSEYLIPAGDKQWRRVSGRSIGDIAGRSFFMFKGGTKWYIADQATGQKISPETVGSTNQKNTLSEFSKLVNENTPVSELASSLGKYAKAPSSAEITKELQSQKKEVVPPVKTVPETEIIPPVEDEYPTTVRGDQLSDEDMFGVPLKDINGKEYTAIRIQAGPSGDKVAILSSEGEGRELLSLDDFKKRFNLEGKQRRPFREASQAKEVIGGKKLSSSIIFSSIYPAKKLWFNSTEELPYFYVDFPRKEKPPFRVVVGLERIGDENWVWRAWNEEGNTRKMLSESVSEVDRKKIEEIINKHLQQYGEELYSGKGSPIKPTATPEETLQEFKDQLRNAIKEFGPVTESNKSDFYQFMFGQSSKKNVINDSELVPLPEGYNSTDPTTWVQANIGNWQKDVVDKALSFLTSEPHTTDTDVGYQLGGIGQILSNFAETPFTFRGKEFRTAEGAYQAWKTGTLQEGFEHLTGYQAKAKGKGQPVNRESNITIMREVLQEKYNQVPEFRSALAQAGHLTHSIGSSFWAEQFPKLLEELRASSPKQVYGEGSSPVQEKASPLLSTKPQGWFKNPFNRVESEAVRIERGKTHTPDSVTELSKWLRSRRYVHAETKQPFSQRDLRKLMGQYETATEFSEAIWKSLDKEDASLLSRSSLVAMHQSFTGRIPRRLVQVIVDEERQVNAKPVTGKIRNPITGRFESQTMNSFDAYREFPEIQLVHGPFEKKGGIYSEPYTWNFDEIGNALAKLRFVTLVPNSDKTTIPIVPLKYPDATQASLNAYRNSLAKEAIKRVPELSDAQLWPEEFKPDKSGNPQWVGLPDKNTNYEMTRLEYLSHLFGPEFLLKDSRVFAKRSGLPFTDGRTLALEVMGKQKLLLAIADDYQTAKGEAMEDGIIWVTPEMMDLYQQSGGTEGRVVKPLIIWRDPKAEKLLILKASIQIAQGQRLQQMNDMGVNHLAMSSSAKWTTGIKKGQVYDVPWESVRIVADHHPYHKRVTTTRSMWYMVDQPNVLKAVWEKFVKPRVNKVNENLRVLLEAPENIDRLVIDNDRVGVAPHPRSLSLLDNILYTTILDDQLFSQKVPGTTAYLRARTPDVDVGIDQVLIPHIMREILGIPKKLDGPKLHKWLEDHPKYVIVYRSPTPKPEAVLRLRVKDVLGKLLGDSVVVHERNVIDKLEADMDGDHLHVLAEETLKGRVFPEEYTQYLQDLMDKKLPHVGPMAEKIQELQERYESGVKHSAGRSLEGMALWKDFLSAKKAVGEAANIQYILASMRANELVIATSPDGVSQISKKKSVPSRYEVVFDPASLSPEEMINARRKLALWIQLGVDNAKLGLISKVWKDRLRAIEDIAGAKPGSLPARSVPTDDYAWANTLYPRGMQFEDNRGLTEAQRKILGKSNTASSQFVPEQMLLSLSTESPIPRAPVGQATPEPMYQLMIQAHKEAQADIIRDAKALSDNDHQVLRELRNLKEDYQRKAAKKEESEEGLDRDDLPEDEYLDKGWQILSRAEDRFRLDKSLMQDEATDIEFRFLTPDGLNVFKTAYFDRLRQGLEKYRSQASLQMTLFPLPIDDIVRRIKGVTRKVLVSGETQFSNSKEWIIANLSEIDAIDPELGKLIQPLLKRDVAVKPFSAEEKREVIQFAVSAKKFLGNKQYSPYKKLVFLSEAVADMTPEGKEFLDNWSNMNERAAGRRVELEEQSYRFLAIAKDPVRGPLLAGLFEKRIKPQDVPIDKSDVLSLYKLWTEPKSRKLLVNTNDPFFKDYPKSATSDSLSNQLYFMLWTTYRRVVQPGLVRTLMTDDQAFRYMYLKMAQSVDPDVDPAAVAIKAEHELQTNRKKLVDAWTDANKLLPYTEGYYPRIIDKKSPEDMRDHILNNMADMEKFGLDPLQMPVIISRMLPRKTEYWKNLKYSQDAGSVISSYIDSVLAYSYREYTKAFYRKLLDRVAFSGKQSPGRVKQLADIASWARGITEYTLGYDTTRFTVPGQVSRIAKNMAYGALSVPSTLKNHAGGATWLWLTYGLSKSGASGGQALKGEHGILDEYTGMTNGELYRRVGISFMKGSTREAGEAHSLSELLAAHRIEKVGGSKRLEQFEKKTRRMTQRSLRYSGFTQSEERWRKYAAIAGYQTEVKFQLKSGPRPGETREMFLSRITKSGVNAARRSTSIVMGDFRPELLPEKLRTSNAINLLTALRRWDIFYVRNIHKMIKDVSWYGATPENVGRLIRLGLLQSVLVGSSLYSGYNIANMIGDPLSGYLTSLIRLFSGDDEAEIPETVSNIGGRMFGAVLRPIAELAVGSNKDALRSSWSLARTIIPYGAIAPALGETAGAATAPFLKSMIDLGITIKDKEDLGRMLLRFLGVYRLRKAPPSLLLRRRRRTSSRSRLRRRE